MKREKDRERDREFLKRREKVRERVARVLIDLKMMDKMEIKKNKKRVGKDCLDFNLRKERDREKKTSKRRIYEKEG